MSGFGDWLDENEIKDLSNHGVIGEDETKADVPSSLIATINPIKAAEWNREDPKLHECFDCRGRGLWSPPVYATRGRTGLCHKCNGRGHFKTSHAERMKSREQRRLRGKAKLTNAKDDFMKEHGDVIEWLKENTSWNSFANDLINGQYGFERRGHLSDGQIGAARKMMAKCIATREAKAAEIASGPTIDLTEFFRIFDRGRETGRKRMSLRMGELKVSPAPGHGRNAGFLYVTDRGDYVGKINPDGHFIPRSNAREEIVDELVEFAKEPSKKARFYGQETGTCCCCGAELTNPESIKAGIGPICAEWSGL